MESFVIVCTTCARKLRVRDASLCGQIVACPKCGAMVQVPDPQAVRLDVGGSEPVDSQAVTREAIEPEGPRLGPFEAPPGENLSAGSPPPVAAWEGEVDPPGLEGPPPHESGPEPVLWQSPRGARARQVGLVVSLLLIGIVTAVSTFGLFVRSWQERQASRRAAVVDPAPEDEALLASEPRDSQPLGAGPTEALTDAAADVDPRGGDAAPDPPTFPQNPLADVSADGDDPWAPPAPGDPVAGESDETSLEPRPEVDSASGAAGAPVAADDAAAGSAAGSAAEEPGLPDELPPGLSQYLGMIDLGASADQFGPPAAERLPTIRELRIEGPEEADALLHPPPADPVDVEARMRVRLVGMEARDQPLALLVRTLGQLAGVPIRLDLESLDAAGIDPGSRQSLKVIQLTVEEALGQVAAAAQCEVRADGPGQLAVVASDALVNRALASALEIGDLEGDPASWAASISRIVGAPVSLAPPSALRVEGTAAQRFRAAMAVDALRSARQLPRRLPAAATERWSVQLSGETGESDSAAEWGEVGRGPVDLDLPRPLAIEMLLGRVAERSDATLVIDWPSAWQHGLVPESSALPWMRGTTVAALLDDLLEPFALRAYRAGSGVWWVGTPARYDSMPLVFQIAAAPSQWEAARGPLAAVLGLDAPEEVPVIFDADSGALIGCLPRYVVRALPEILGGEELGGQ